MKWVPLVSHFIYKHPELKSLAHSHMASKWQSLDSNSESLALGAHTLTPARQPVIVAQAAVAPRRGRSLSLEVREGLLEEETCILEEHEGLARQTKQGRVFQAEGTTCAKTQSGNTCSSSGGTGALVSEVGHRVSPRVDGDER